MLQQFKLPCVRSFRFASGLKGAARAVVIAAALVLTGAVLFSLPAKAQSEDAAKYEAAIAEEMAYRQSVDSVARAWAEDLMFMYKWNAKYLSGWTSGPQFSVEDGDFPKRFHSELAWLVIAGEGYLATFDFKHAQSTLAGSTSRFVKTLMLSTHFWLEVRTQCRDIRDLRIQRLAQKGRHETPAPLADCAEKFRSDLVLSQLVSSNVSILLTGGLIAGGAKKLFTRYASKWFAARVVPIIPVAMRSKYVLGGLAVAAITLPPAIIFAGVSQEHKANRKFYDGLETSIKENTEQMAHESVMKAAALETEREVFELALWMNSNMPPTATAVDVVDDEAAANFVFRLKMYAPNFSKLQAKRAELEKRRVALEAELAAMPGISVRLSNLAEKRKAGRLEPEDALLFRKAQYLASLRLVLRSL